jgi:hypothetical protein
LAILSAPLERAGVDSGSAKGNWQPCQTQKPINDHIPMNNTGDKNWLILHPRHYDCEQPNRDAAEGENYAERNVPDCY